MDEKIKKYLIKFIFRASFLMLVSEMLILPCYAINLKKEVVLDEVDGKSIILHYNPQVCNVDVKNISTESYIKELNVATFKIGYNASKTFRLEYDSGPSQDPGFYIIDNKFNIPFDEKLSGLEIAIYGDDYIYVWGHINDVFNRIKAYQISKGRLIEVVQPFYYVGLKTKTLKPIVIYSSKEMNKKVAVVENNKNIEILINDGNYYLIKTENGILGWWHSKQERIYKSDEIEGLNYKGD